MLSDLDGTNLHRAPVAKLHLFRADLLTDEQLKMEASNSSRDFLIDQVLDAREYDDGEIGFLVHWTGFPDADPDDPESWVPYYNCWNNLFVLDYIRLHPHIKAAVKRRNRRFGYPRHDP